MIIKCGCREVSIAKSPDLQREMTHGLGVFCGRCRTMFREVKVITVEAKSKSV